jgi:hypothetical protein
VVAYTEITEPPVNETTTRKDPSMSAADDGFLPVPIDVIEDLAALVGVLEDWLLHASDDTLADLAQFAGGGPFTRRPAQHARQIARELGGHHQHLRRALHAAGIAS